MVSVPRTGCVVGVFDLFHVGHIDVLERARRQCDRLVVAVLSDEWALDAWGARPFVPLPERAQILEHLRCVDEVISVDEVVPPGEVATASEMAGTSEIVAVGDVLPEWLTGVHTVFAASAMDGVLSVAELDRMPPALLTILPAGRTSRSPILRAAIDQRQSRSSVA
ncbi:adenylyltransferase/cytidyltransferase family protein [Kribbella hippodromi]|uniref:adenylyltransferase/cytidyltransferase family protein n=1 Tax=Kribbella hippodromi TaxID=434347 RepID=UPI0031DA8FA9